MELFDCLELSNLFCIIAKALSTDFATEVDHDFDDNSGEGPNEEKSNSSSNP